MKSNDKHKRQELDDKVIKDLFKEFTLEEAPESIKQNAMNRVLHDWVQKPQTHQPFINNNNRWWIILGLAAVLAVTFIVDASVIQSYLKQFNISSETVDFTAVNTSLKNYFAFAAQVPALVYFVGVGILLLLGIDKLLNRLANF